MGLDHHVAVDLSNSAPGLRGNVVLQAGSADVAPVVGVNATSVHTGAVVRDPSPVLIVGETGTSRDRVARELHEKSGR